MSCDGNGELEKTKQTEPTTCPTIHGSPIRVDAVRHRVRHHLGTCVYTTHLTWNTALGGVPTLASEYTSSTGTDFGHTDFIMGPNGEPVEQVYVDTGGAGAQTPDWYYPDFQGNTRKLMNKTAVVNATYNEPPYGTATSWINGDSNATPLQHSGTYTDQWSLMVFDQSRWHDPATGQFLSQDPSAYQSLQAFAYAGDDPSGSSRASPSASLPSPFSGVVVSARFKQPVSFNASFIGPDESCNLTRNINYYGTYGLSASATADCQELMWYVQIGLVSHHCFSNPPPGGVKPCAETATRLSEPITRRKYPATVFLAASGSTSQTAVVPSIATSQPTGSVKIRAHGVPTSRSNGPSWTTQQWTKIHGTLRQQDLKCRSRETENTRLRASGA